VSRVKAKDIQRKGKSIYEEKGIYACRSGTAYEFQPVVESPVMEEVLPVKSPARQQHLRI
jgi:hypothetical protein